MSITAGLAPEALTPARSRAEVPLFTARALDGGEWDSVVAGFDGVCQEQLYGFASIRWPGVTQEPRLFEQNGRIVGGALVMVQKLPLGLSKIAIIKWAPMLADMAAPDASALYDGMIDALIDEYAKRRGMMLSILPHASPLERNAEYLTLRERGFKRGAVLKFPDRYLVNLRQSDEAQRKSFDQGWRRQLNKADKSDLSFEHAGHERLDEFKTLYGVMTDRKQFPDYSAYDTLDALMRMDEPLRPELFFVRHEGELVAGALIFKAGERAVYLYGATNDKALPLRAGYFMHWHIIRWLRDNTRATWYDLGGTDGFHGLHQFKKGMVGSAGVIKPVPPVANYATRPLAYAFGAGAFWAREAIAELRRRVDAAKPSGAKPDQEPHQLEDYLK